MSFRNDFTLTTLSVILVTFVSLGINPGFAAADDSDDGADSQKKAPSFEARTIQGDTVSLKSYLAEEKPFVVYFSASWCPICAKNRPVLENVYQDYKDKLNLVMISIDPTDTKKVMKRLAEKEGLTYPIVPGSPEIMRDFGVTSQATTVGVTPEGHISFIKQMTALSETEYRFLFDRLLS